MAKFGKSLVSQFTIIILVILIVGQGTLYTWLLLYQRSYLEENLRGQMTEIAKHCAGVAAAPAADLRGLEGLLDLAVKTRGVLSVRVVDERGSTLAERVAPRAGDDDAGGGLLGPLFFMPDRNTVSVPFRPGSRGGVEVVYSGGPVNAVMGRFLVIPPIMQVMTFLVVISAILLFFRRQVSVPVARINESLRRITEGDLVAEVPDLGGTELGSVADGARFLAAKLAATIARLHSLSNEVASALQGLAGVIERVGASSRAEAEAIAGVVSVIRKADEQQRTSTEDTEQLARLSDDNVSSLAEMKTVADSIAESTEDLFRTTADAHAMISSLSESSKTIADGSREVHRAMEETSASVEEITSSLGSVRENARQSTGSSMHVRKLLTERGTLAVAEAIDAMEKIAEEVARFEAAVTQLDERSKDIEKVLVVIRDVTESTNLLSLNAAILAEQAGAQGKGFAVVAGEIRSLSEGAETSAREITKIVGAIRSQIRGAVDSIREGVKKVDEGKELILKSGEAMGQTLEAAQKSAQMTAVVEKATEEQETGLRQIRLAVENVRRMMEQMSKSTEEETRSAARIFDGISGVRDVAEVVRKATHEHAAGTQHISRNLEASRDMVTHLRQAAQLQLKSNEEIVSAVDRIRKEGEAAMRDLEELTRSFGTLQGEVDALKSEMAVFRTKGEAGKG